MSQSGTRSGLTYVQKSAAIQANFSDSGKPKSKKKMNSGRQEDGAASEGALDGAAPEAVPPEAPTGVSPTVPQTSVLDSAAREVVLDSADPPGTVHDTTYQGKGALPQDAEETSQRHESGEVDTGNRPTTQTQRSTFEKGSSSKDLGSRGKKS